MASARDWVAGARPRTLPAAIVPVAVGTGVAAGYGRFSPGRAALALFVALALQIGVNYANDYSDGIRGTDDQTGRPAAADRGRASPRPGRSWPRRWPASPPPALAGLVLAALTSWWVLLLGAAAVAAAWFYTGGDRPYGYRALGELSVFVFFGLAAVAGTAYVQQGTLTWLALAAAVPVGLLACALLVVNNLRDIPTDSVSRQADAGRAAGDQRTRLLYGACALAPFAVAVAIAPARPLALVTLAALPLAVAPVRRVRGGAAGPRLIAVLGQTGGLQLAFGALLTLGLAIRF